MVPFLLPKMHERYYFLADVLSIVYAFYFPRKWYYPVLTISVSTLSYLAYWIQNDFTGFLVPVILALVALLLKDIFSPGDQSPHQISSAA
jgi:Gpi18-like mannosyltransferase